MANGTAVRLLDPPSTDLAPTELEQRIGEATASAMATLYAAVQYAQAGELTREIKLIGAERIARVALLQLEHERGDQDFISTARHAGMHALRRVLNGSSTQPEKILDYYLDQTLDLVARVVADERTFRAAMAN